MWGGGLIGLMVLIAAVVITVEGRYPSGVFDFVLGMNRWVLRVAAYAGLMTDVYPPFRMDLGGAEPTVAPAGSPLPAEPGSVLPATPSETPPPAPARPDQETGRWTGGRVAAMVIGVFLLVMSLGLLGGGGVALWADQTQRDGAGFLTSPARTFSTGTYALTTEGSAGIGATVDVARYLRGTARAIVTDPTRSGTRIVPGGPPPAAPGGQPFWLASSAGAGSRTVVWTPTEGSWTVAGSTSARTSARRCRRSLGYPPDC